MLRNMPEEPISQVEGHFQNMLTSTIYELFYSRVILRLNARLTRNFLIWVRKLVMSDPQVTWRNIRLFINLIHSSFNHLSCRISLKTDDQFLGPISGPFRSFLLTVYNNLYVQNGTGSGPADRTLVFHYLTRHPISTTATRQYDVTRACKFISEVADG